MIALKYGQPLPYSWWVQASLPGVIPTISQPQNDYTDDNDNCINLIAHDSIDHRWTQGSEQIYAVDR